MPATKALVREPGRTFSRCISTHPLRHAVDVARAREQHAVYAATIEELGLEVIRLARDDDLPDSCFVEDTAVVHGRNGLICRSAKEARRAEAETVEEILSQHLKTRRAIEPATVEGGDVLHVGDRLVCGITQRTNDEGVRQMADWLGVRVDAVHDPSIMHLKSYASHIDEGRILVSRGYSTMPAFDGLDRLLVPEGEEYAANVLSVNGTVVMPKGFPGTKDVLERAGIEVIALEMTEFPKCDGAMTCLSILF